MSLNRISGLLVAALGALLLFRVIPAQVEDVAYGWVRPETVPNAVAAGFVVLGLAQAVLARGATDLAAASAIRAGLYLAIAALAAWAMGQAGFVWVAPAMMLVLMLLIGERRPVWLGLGVVVLPAAVWGVVVGLLDRPLPG